jgi:predicted metalloprotease with PDZ domain
VPRTARSTLEIDVYHEGQLTGDRPAPTSLHDHRSCCNRLPQPTARPAPVIEPQDVDYCGLLRLEVDATDVIRRIFRARQIIPVAGPGPLTLLYPQWLPGYHSPVAPIELFAGLTIEAGGERLQWRRHPTEVYAFELDVPAGVDELEASFQFLSPTNASQGRIVVSPDLLNLEWNMVVLYPAGHFARRIMVEPSLTLPPDWQLACALDVARQESNTTHFAPVALDDLVDSPVFAGRHFRRIDLDETGEVRLNIVADRPDLLDASDEQIEPHREMIRQADRLFASRPFDHFDVLLALSDEIGSIGVEHHRSCEAASIPDYFTNWDSNVARRDTIPHEYVHSWNGKYRRGADSWVPSFDQPIRNSLMWVYEGQTQYWDRVLCARSGLWKPEHALQAIAETAATHAIRAGSVWRPLSDTTRDPIIASRASIPWPSWQRSEDYYTEGSLIWLDVDTRIRELTDEKCSLDDFALVFFAVKGGEWVTNTYEFDDVIRTLKDLAPFDWAAFFDEKLHGTGETAPLDGIERGGYQLVYRDHPSDYLISKQTVFGISNFLFSIGLAVGTDGAVAEVLWDSPAFHAGLTAGSQILGVNGRGFTCGQLHNAIACAGADKAGEPIELLVKDRLRNRQVQIECPSGHRYPDLEPIAGARRRLDDILSPRTS